MDGCTRSELRRRSGGVEFVVLDVSLIWSSSPVSRLSSSSNYTSCSPSVLSAFAFSSCFGQAIASDHSAHTPTTTPFQYACPFCAVLAYGHHGLTKILGSRRPLCNCTSFSTWTYSLFRLERMLS